MPKPLEEILRESEPTTEGYDEMARRLRRLDERHQKALSRGGDGPVCACGDEWPCPDRRLLEGEER